MKQGPENRETSAGKHGFWSVWSCYGVLEEFPAREVSDFFDSHFPFVNFLGDSQTGKIGKTSTINLKKGNFESVVSCQNCRNLSQLS